MKLAVFLLGVFISSAVVTGYILWPRPVKIQKTTTVATTSQNTQIVHSNKWFSSVYKGLPTSPLYTLPLVFQFTSEGLGVSYPQINAQPNTVFASYTPDLIISTNDPLKSVSPEQIGDWHVKFVGQTTKGDTFRATLAQGAPYSHLETSSGVWKINFPADAKYSSDTKTSTVVSINSHSYLLVWEKDAVAVPTSKQLVISNSVKLYIGLLADIDNLSYISDVANSPIEGTQATWQILPDRIDVTYTYTSSKPAYIALLPHQKSLLSSPPEQGSTYSSIRGPLTAIRSSNFTLNYPKIIPPLDFATPSANKKEISEQLDKDVDEFLSTPYPGSKNYGASVWMGKVASLIQLTKVVGTPEQTQKLISSASALLSDAPNWYVKDASQSSLIAKTPEYGNERLNDHHFHYGYIIRLAAILCQNDPSKCPELTPFVNNLISDISSTDRTSSAWPFLRNFDLFESHSWADGYSQSPDGGNQESSSEAINAWYAIYLWSQATHQSELASTALYLYNAEIIGTQYYWFNLGDTLPPEYQHQVVSLVWGGKSDFATWFGDKANYKYGIQILPLTPGSIYLGQIPNFFKYEADFLRSGGQYKQSWGELMLAWKSYSSKDIDISQLPSSSEVIPLSVVKYLIYTHQAQQ